MEFSIDIHYSLQGDITIEDFSKEYGYYAPEGDSYPDAQIVEVDGVSTLKYKYSKTVTLSTILKVNTSEMILKDVLIHTHDTEDSTDICEFHVEEDGYYAVNHFVLPTREWYDSFLKNTDTELQEFISEGIYFIEAGKLYKIVKGEIKEAEIKELLERNYEGTNILHCKIDLFFNGNLQQCYINYCKHLYDALIDGCHHCDKDKYSEEIYARDFIWMTLNIIDYLVGFKQFMEAERIIEQFKSCGGFCQDHNPKKHAGCGCSKA